MRKLMRMNLTLENPGKPPGTEIRKRKQEDELQSRHRIHDGNAPYGDGEQREESGDASERFVRNDQPFHSVRRGVVPVEYCTPIRGNSNEEKSADDIRHARPKEPVDKARLEKNELDEDCGGPEKDAGGDDEPERIPGELEVRNEYRADDEQEKCRNECARKVLVEKDVCELGGHDRRHGAHNGEGSRSVAGLESGVEKKHGQYERHRRKHGERENGERRD